MLPVYEIRKSDLTVKRNKYELDFTDHMHKYVEIVYVYKGGQHLKINNNSYNITAGSAAVIFPDTVHSYFSSDKKDTDVLILMCAPKLFGSLFPKLNNKIADNAVIDASQINDELKFALNAIRPEQNFTTRFSWACVILSYLLDCISVHNSDSAPIEDISYKIIKYVEENFTDDISRESLAKSFNISEGYISKIFSQRFRMNLRSYLGQIRAEYAAMLIRTTDETLTSISHCSGFNSIRTFNRMFKAAYKMTPTEYKDNLDRFTKQ